MDQTVWVFLELKKALTSSSILRKTDFNLPFIVHTDGSERALRAVLSQIFQGKAHPILYISRHVSPTERKYTAMEQETLTIKSAIK